MNECPDDVVDHPRFTIENYYTGSFREELASDVMRGMTSRQKWLPSKYFYDRRGSRLFEQICHLPEYYLTRTELGVLRKCRNQIMGDFSCGDLVELGSGANWKVRILLDVVDGERCEKLRYIPVDVSRSALIRASHELIDAYPRLNVLAIVADFTSSLSMLPREGPRLFTLFGSTIGNFTERECRHMLTIIADIMGDEDRLLLGLDMVKNTKIIERAYNDERGLTSAFNKNILLVVNRELGADFSPSIFDHLAFYNEERDQVEMHLRAPLPVEVTIRDLGIVVHLDRGETIITEISRKFLKDGCERLFSDCGLSVRHWYSDPKKWFSLVELVKA